MKHSYFSETSAVTMSTAWPFFGEHRFSSEHRSFPKEQSISVKDQAHLWDERSGSRNEKICGAEDEALRLMRSESDRGTPRVTKIFVKIVTKKVWPRRDSNTQPSDLESDALPLRHGVTSATNSQGAMEKITIAHDRRSSLRVVQRILALRQRLPRSFSFHKDCHYSRTAPDVIWYMY